MRFIAGAAKLISGATTLAALALFLSGNAAIAGKYSVRYDFCSLSGCVDGAGPVGVLSDGAGHVFGTTYPGGANNLGTVFELSRNGANGSVSETVIYSFCSLANCSDGELPAGSLIRDTKGDLYGMTNEGGAFGPGEVYRLTRRNAAWALETLYSFCSRRHCSDGGFPWAGLTYAGAATGAAYDGKSPLFGTTSSGGAYGQGTVFALRHGREGWTAKTLYSFCALSNCSDGAAPAAALTIDASGNIYGTAANGGQGQGQGVVFELTQSNGQWTETVLHAFCGAKDCKDGAVPIVGLAMDASGTLYGATHQGGLSCIDRDFGPCGVIYSLVPAGANSPYSILYSFGQHGRSDDGANPVGSLIIDASGNLFGITVFGGAAGNGVAWELSGSRLKALHTFCVVSGDGCDPSSLYRDENGRLLGTTSGGGTGTDSNGTVFEIRP